MYEIEITRQELLYLLQERFAIDWNETTVDSKLREENTGFWNGLSIKDQITSLRTMIK